ncbi:uncharacterized protein KY384_007760 [Bacidia gigantensis]|uniref:uncharacterized protein n=1 Tax=Bacidia gigantensis TaxID=2732470 RepID=UPI001D03FB1C|nr:uncharacterized protein KY384_007760 [Bacidia gigantensis]KAG8527607.1 hypothetical protein KY384_007760 [Bacidia gigantensis]
MESVSRISALLESTRDLTVDAASSIGSGRTINSRPSQRDLSSAQVSKLLGSRSDREVLEGLRTVISMMYRSRSCLPFFSAVVKNVASPNLEIKKLVYIYLLHHAESEPDLALLSINTIHKSLSDQNPQLRSLALRVISGIRVPVISQIVSLAIKRGIADMSPYVRKAAALAIPKCYKLDPSTLPQLLDYLSVLLGDRQYYVVGPAVTAFLELCPERIDLIHKHYRPLVHKLVDMDEWGQLATLRLLTSYARRCFPKKTRRRKTKESQGFYEDEGNAEAEGEAEDTSLWEEYRVLDPDLELLIKACKPLLSSRNSAVIVAAARCLLYLGTPEDLDATIGPLIALLRSPRDIQLVAMYNIVAFCLVRAQSFVRYASHFLIHTTDVLDLVRLKFEVLTLIFPLCERQTRELILSEFEHFTRSSDAEVVQESVRAIGRCARNDKAASTRCLHLLLLQLSSRDGNLVAESLNVIRHLIQQEPQAHVKTVIRLAKNLDIITNPRARATIIWLVGENAGLPEKENIAPDVLRILAKDFANEAEDAKMQIVLLAAKVYLHYLIRSTFDRTNDSAQESTEDSSPIKESVPKDDMANAWINEAQSTAEQDDHPIPKLWHYIVRLTRYDTSYDLRDRARMYMALLANTESTQLATLLLLAPKPVPYEPSPSENRAGLQIGSSSLVIGNTDMNGYEDLPEWVKEGEEPDPQLREEPAGDAGTGKTTFSSQRDIPAATELDRAVKEKGLGKLAAAAAKDKSLDEWLNEESETEDGSSEGETETEEESADEYETESESGDEGEEERLVQR